jgi:YHS domain-containing protein
VEENLSKPVKKTVCGSEIDDHDQYPSALYRGEIVQFCTDACLRAFQGDPDRFIAGEIEHPAGNE